MNYVAILQSLTEELQRKKKISHSANEDLQFAASEGSYISQQDTVSVVRQFETESEEKRVRYSPFSSLLSNIVRLVVSELFNLIAFSQKVIGSQRAPSYDSSIFGPSVYINELSIILPIVIAKLPTIMRIKVKTTKSYAKCYIRMY